LTHSVLYIYYLRSICGHLHYLQLLFIIRLPVFITHCRRKTDLFLQFSFNPRTRYIIELICFISTFAFSCFLSCFIIRFTNKKSRPNWFQPGYVCFSHAIMQQNCEFMLHFIHDDLKCYRSMFCPSVYIPLTLSVTLVTPAKAIGGNKMPFDRDTCMVPSNIVLRPGIYPIEKRQRFRIKTSFQSKLSLQTATKPLPIAKWYYTKSV